MGLRDSRTPNDRVQVGASARELEHVDISGGDHDVVINGGVGMAIYCDTAGEIIKIDNTMMTGYTTLALQAGINEIEVTKVYQTGSTITGNVDVYAW
jgi:hypothetical protein